MPHVLKKKIKQDVFARITNRFAETIFDLRRKEQGKNFLHDFLTPTERLMLAKRLSIIFLLNEGYSTYRIHKILNVSISTVRRMRHGFQEGAFEHVVKVFKSRKQRELFWTEIETLFRGGLPKMGRGRWSGLYRRTSKR